MEKKDNHTDEVKVKVRKPKRNIITKIVAIFIAIAMVLATCSTFIYYILINV